jgi:hypothetical protein
MEIPVVQKCLFGLMRCFGDGVTGGVVELEYGWFMVLG